MQGVGFRPFVWALAREFGLTGRVWNDPEGVGIEVWGEVEGFVAALSARAPALARVDGVEVAPLDGAAPEGFEIAESRGRGAETRVVPDAATCPACLAEVQGDGRRKGYAFTNCTHCGPRFSILRGLPYDRGQTTMAGFGLCAACAAEYRDPSDRRFHAQPIACPDCGPRLWFEPGGGDPIARAVEVLRAGGVVAVKGLGGFHLACDAGNPAALALLRGRKRRPAKPFALMGSLAALAEVADLTGAEALLADPAAPVVLVPSRRVLPEGVAPGMATLGVMLPATPLHHLLVAGFGGVLVMTSGNLSGEPQVIGNDEAREKLAGFVDGFLCHDRDIARRLDDGVERASPRMVLRRGRGRVPGVLPVPFPGQTLALGGQMKGAVCAVKNGQALLGHHLGDLDGVLNAAEFHKAIADYTALFDLRPQVVACDLHPDFTSTRAAEAMGLPVVRVQHHHAHLAACLAENLWQGGRVAGIVLDGTGLGQDGTIWGGELLLGDYRGFERVGGLAPAPLPGGDRAAREPWRNALMRLDQAGESALAERLFGGPVATLRAMAAKGVNAPMGSSAGRLFDAVAGCLGIGAQSYEGEAAMRLEALAGDVGEVEGYAFDGLDPAPMFRQIARDLGRVAPEMIAARFHEGLAAAFSGLARRLVREGRAEAVALTGGCLQNAVLHRALVRHLGDVPVLVHRETPCGDGGLALGQAMVALAQMERG